MRHVHVRRCKEEEGATCNKGQEDDVARDTGKQWRRGRICERVGRGGKTR